MKEINANDISKTPFELIGGDWALLTAAKKDGSFNMMTVSWGGMGVLWGKNVFQCYVRPQRHTFGFTEEADYISLNFFSSEFKDVLSYCGSKSGRDFDKAKECGLSPVDTGTGIYYSEAALAVLGKKLYSDVIREDCFIGVDPGQWYKDDYHKLYICEIIKILEK